MFWYNVISHNPSYYFKMCISEITTTTTKKTGRVASKYIRSQQRTVRLPPVHSAAELARGQSQIPPGEMSSARSKFACAQVLLVYKTPL